jgi:hypothetical protein
MYKHTTHIPKMYKGIRKKKRRENLREVKLAQTRYQNLPISTINCMQEINRGHGDVFWRGGSLEVIRLMAIARLKMKNICIYAM